MDTNQKVKQQQQVVQGRIAKINEEIPRLQVKLRQLELKLVDVMTDLKTDFKSKL